MVSLWTCKCLTITKEITIIYFLWFHFNKNTPKYFIFYFKWFYFISLGLSITYPLYTHTVFGSQFVCFLWLRGSESKLGHYNILLLVFVIQFQSFTWTLCGKLLLSLCSLFTANVATATQDQVYQMRWSLEQAVNISICFLFTYCVCPTAKDSLCRMHCHTQDLLWMG